MTKYRRLGGLNDMDLLSHCSGGWKPKVRVSARSDSDKRSLPALQVATFLLHPYAVQTASSLVSLLFKRFSFFIFERERELVNMSAGGGEGGS